MNRHLHSGRSQHGFSLLEVLVAFAILALAVGTLLSLFATGLRNTAAAADYARALTVAESQLVYYQGIDAKYLEERESEGMEQGFFWRSRVSAYGDVATAGRLTRLYRIDVDVKWEGEGKSRAVQLSTLRIGKSP